jgi:hypothetical protein
MARGTGYIPDTDARVAAEERLHHIGGLVGSAPRNVPASVSLLSFAGGVVDDQGSTNSCVSHAGGACMFIGAAANGTPIARPSRLWGYAVARLYRPRQGPLADIGCRPSDYFDGLSEFGMCAESRYPFDLGAIDNVPPLDVRQNAGDALITGRFRIPPGPGAFAWVQRSIAARRPVFVGMPVDAAFMALGADGEWPGCVGPEVGRHAMAVVGYHDDKVLVLNSYGPNWGRNGCVSMPASWVESWRVSDMQAFTTLPKVLT